MSCYYGTEKKDGVQLGMHFSSQSGFQLVSGFLSRGRSRAAATSKLERFVIIVNGFQPLTIIIKRSILDVAAALDLLLQDGVRCTELLIATGVMSTLKFPQRLFVWFVVDAELKIIFFYKYTFNE